MILPLLALLAVLVVVLCVTDSIRQEKNFGKTVRTAVGYQALV